MRLLQYGTQFGGKIFVLKKKKLIELEIHRIQYSNATASYINYKLK